MSEPMREVSRLWGEDGARFGALLQSDRGQSSDMDRDRSRQSGSGDQSRRESDAD